MKDKIIEDYRNGMTPLDISHKYGVSRSYVYQVVSAIKAQERVSALPLIDDSKTVNELKQRIDELNEKIRSLEETNDRLLRIIEKLTVGN